MATLEAVSSTIFDQPDGSYFHNGLLNLDDSPTPSYGSLLQFLSSGPLSDGSGARYLLPGGLTLDITNPPTTILSTPRFTNNTRSQIVRPVGRGEDALTRP